MNEAVLKITFRKAKAQIVKLKVKSVNLTNTCLQLGADYNFCFVM